MKTSTFQEEHGIQLTAWIWQGYLEFSHDLYLFSHAHQQMQMKTTSVLADLAAAGLNIHAEKPRPSNTT
ncbi:unnamed protein product [Schistosoma margrebowiei]|uniref:Uncharacterized protein n=1 Tax=Schistosoma margrebowiei TaxID=48269 RepID=A0A183LVU6_9TREM|nr:unnamed protein product [Schistosoma margrebowiei]